MDEPRRLRDRGARAGFTVTAESPGAPVAAFEDLAGRRAGVQFHPEVGAHPARARRCSSASCTTSPASSRPGRPSNIIDEQVAAIRAQVGDKQVICGLSGGVDSAVAAALVHRAVGDQLTCVFVDHGLLRAGEAEQVEKDYVAATGIRLKVVDAADRFLGALAGVTDPEQKRKIIGREFIRVFEAGGPRGRRRAATSSSWCRAPSTRTWSSPAAAPAPPTSSRHHNVGGLPEDLQVRAGRAAAHAVQGRGPRDRRAQLGPARGDGLAAPVPRARAWPSGSSARSPATGSTCCARPT